MNHKHSDQIDSFSKKKEFSELKRIEAVRLNQCESRQRKDAIRQALSHVDGKKSAINKKIVFTDDDPAPKGSELFPENGDVEDWNDSFNIAPQYEGRRGHKLLELQSRFGNDERFRFDSRFAESSDDEETAGGKNGVDNYSNNEYKTNMQALQQVVGVKSPSENKQKIFRDVSHLRYDPTKRESERFKKKREEKQVKNYLPVVGQEPPPQVSGEHFYQVAGDFRESLAEKSGKGFSLLSTFSSQPLLQTNEEEKKKMKDPTASRAKVKDPKPTARNTEKATPKNYVPHPKSEVGSRFFICPGDYRLKEGVRFFRRQQDVEEIKDQWRNGRENTKKIFQLKHRRAERKRWNTPRRKR